MGPSNQRRPGFSPCSQKPSFLCSSSPTSSVLPPLTGTVWLDQRRMLPQLLMPKSQRKTRRSPQRKPQRKRHPMPVRENQPLVENERLIERDTLLTCTSYQNQNCGINKKSIGIWKVQAMNTC